MKINKITELTSILKACYLDKLNSSSELNLSTALASFKAVSKGASSPMNMVEELLHAQFGQDVDDPWGRFRIQPTAVYPSQIERLNAKPIFKECVFMTEDELNAEMRAEFPGLGKTEQRFPDRYVNWCFMEVY